MANSDMGFSDESDNVRRGSSCHVCDTFVYPRSLDGKATYERQIVNSAPQQQGQTGSFFQRPRC